MSNTCRATLATLLMLLGSSAAAQGTRMLPGFALSGQTGRLSVYARTGTRVNAKQLDKRLAHFETLLDQSVGSAVYYQYDYPEEVALATGTYAGGVTFASGHEVHSTKAASDHELVHLVGDSLGKPGAFFQEGLAVALGDRGLYAGRPVNGLAKGLVGGRRLSQVIAQFDPREPGTGYALAGSFVGRLIQRHGIPQLKAFFHATRRNSVEAAFLQTYGTTLDEQGLQWAASL